MQEALASRFGVKARGLWLTERVWEPDLPGDLAEAGVEYVLVDDRHFVAAGFGRDELHLPFRTEACGRSIGVFAIDEKLRYLIPFHPPEDTAGYLRHLRARGKRLAVAADDIEKFGGWPGTREWVYDRGWLEGFIRAMAEMEAGGEIRLATFAEAFEQLPSGGPAYLPSASYREMEEWSLPTEGYRRLVQLKAELGEERFARGDSPLIRGSHWRNFLVKYPEANRMHKKMLALSRLCRVRGGPESARRAIGRAQCNDAYWHGVFGGLYLRHLRDANWANLAEAEGILRSGEGMAWEELDLDMDGHQELWIHSGAFSALVSPLRGGALEELTLFEPRVNLANVLTRRREAYHLQNKEPPGEEGTPQKPPDQDREGQGEGTPSIHDLEEGLRFRELPPVDAEDRVLFRERVLPAGLDLTAIEQGRYAPVWSWAGTPLAVRAIRESSSRLQIVMETCGGPFLAKTLEFEADGSLDVDLRWDPGGFPPGALLATELSLGAEAVVVAEHSARVWRHPISTFSKSERGFDETIQGESVTVAWPVEAGEGKVRLRAR
jgi:alpha-amylase